MDAEKKIDELVATWRKLAPEARAFLLLMIDKTPEQRRLFVAFVNDYTAAIKSEVAHPSDLPAVVIADLMPFMVQ